MVIPTRKQCLERVPFRAPKRHVFEDLFRRQLLLLLLDFRVEELKIMYNWIETFRIFKAHAKFENQCYRTWALKILKVSIQLYIIFNSSTLKSSNRRRSCLLKRSSKTCLLGARNGTRSRHCLRVGITIFGSSEVVPKQLSEQLTAKHEVIADFEANRDYSDFFFLGVVINKCIFFWASVGPGMMSGGRNMMPGGSLDPYRCPRASGARSAWTPKQS
jgi:hypothetical protein